MTLGLVKENIETLMNAIKYLNDHAQRADHKAAARLAQGGKKF